jgi:hypothetical protein
MTESKTTTRRRTHKKVAWKKANTVPDSRTPASSRPGGKLGKLVERLEIAEGATLAELTALTGWQPHTVRAALTRLRQRGFKICLEARNDRKAYYLGEEEG